MYVHCAISSVYQLKGLCEQEKLTSVMTGHAKRQLT